MGNLAKLEVDVIAGDVGDDEDPDAVDEGCCRTHADSDTLNANLTLNAQWS